MTGGRPAAWVARSDTDHGQPDANLAGWVERSDTHHRRNEANLAGWVERSDTHRRRNEANLVGWVERSDTHRRRNEERTSDPSQVRDSSTMMGVAALDPSYMWSVST